jgi:hypothetical protein
MEHQGSTGSSARPIEERVEEGSFIVAVEEQHNVSTESEYE